jgi:hypothetical protein
VVADLGPSPNSPPSSNIGLISSNDASPVALVDTGILYRGRCRRRLLARSGVGGCAEIGPPVTPRACFGFSRNDVFCPLVLRLASDLDDLNCKDSSVRVGRSIVGVFGTSLYYAQPRSAPLITGTLLVLNSFPQLSVFIIPFLDRCRATRGNQWHFIDFFHL